MGHRPPVLLVEDEVLAAEYLVSELEDAGYQVLHALNGSDAITILNGHFADLKAILTDVRLGLGPSGWDVARAARQKAPYIPVVYTTAESPDDWAAYGVPNSLLVTKPFAASQLIIAIGQLITDLDSHPSPDRTR